ncbi:MAG: PilZ domain-containing protein [Spirochaetaceae bacterium]|nr:PilZ domain-containing protein [Spirochaetaceae bacterium]
MGNSIAERKKRRNPRYYSRARAYIMNVLDEAAIVKDISVTGCSISYNKPVDIKLHEMYVIHVQPENKRLDKFELLAESRWRRVEGESCEIGFSIISSPFVFSQYKTKCKKRVIS